MPSEVEASLRPPASGCAVTGNPANTRSPRHGCASLRSSPRLGMTSNLARCSFQSARSWQGRGKDPPAKPETGHHRTPDDPLGDDNRTRQYQPTQDAQRFIQISRRPGTSKRPRTWCGGVLLVTCRQRRTAYSLIQAFQNISPCWVCGLKPWRSADRELRLAASPTLIIGTSS